MSTQHRLKQLEKRQPANRPPLVLAFGLPDDGLYHGPDGATYTEAQADELTKTHTVLVLEWVNDWPPEGRPRRVGTTMARLGDVDFERI